MKPFLAAVLVLSTVAVGAWLVLDNTDWSTRSVYSSSNVRF